MKRALAFLILLAASCASLAQGAPDLILFNAKVYTADDAQPTAEAVAIRGERIVAVGGNASVRALAGGATRSIDLRGQMLLPGFNDAHTHFGNAVEWYFQVMLMHVDDQAELLRLLEDLVEQRAQWRRKDHEVGFGKNDEAVDIVDRSGSRCLLPVAVAAHQVIGDAPLMLAQRHGRHVGGVAGQERRVGHRGSPGRCPARCRGRLDNRESAL